MPDLKGATNVYLVLAFVVPGLIIAWTRAQFITGRLMAMKDNFIAYLALSVIYYAVAFPAVEYLLTFKDAGWAKALAWLTIVFVGPFVAGLLLGLASQREWLRVLATRLGINTVHASPTAWDRVFANRRGSTFVMVTLADGSIVAGVFGSRSFASSEPSERDLLIEEIWDVAETGAWTQRPEKIAIYVPAKEVKHVQFWTHQGAIQ